MGNDCTGRNPRIGVHYGAGALLTSLLVVAGWPWTAPLLWPTLSFAVAVAGYLGVGPAIYRKRDGVLSMGTRLMMAPILWGQYLSLRYYKRQCRPWDMAAPGLLIGRLLTEAEAAQVLREGVTAVLDLTVEFSEAQRLRAIIYRNLPILDLTAPTTWQLKIGVGFLRNQIEAGGTVYVHCKVGYSRTAAVVGAYLIASGQCRSVEDAVRILKTVRPSIVIRPEAMKALQAFEKGTG